MAETINVRVRKAIRLDTTKVSDAEISEQIDRAVDYVNRDTDAGLTVSNNASATSGDDYYDDLIVFRVAWQIYIFLFQSGTRSKDPNMGNAAVFNVYEQNYLQTLAVEYPLKVEFHSGLYHYANVRSGGSGSGSGGSNAPAYPDTFVMDNRGDEPGLWGAGREFEDL